MLIYCILLYMFYHVLVFYRSHFDSQMEMFKLKPQKPSSSFGEQARDHGEWMRMEGLEPSLFCPAASLHRENYCATYIHLKNHPQSLALQLWSNHLRSTEIHSAAPMDQLCERWCSWLMWHRVSLKRPKSCSQFFFALRMYGMPNRHTSYIIIHSRNFTQWLNVIRDQ